MNGLLAVGALLLLGAGALKAWRPDTTAKAMGVAPVAVRAGALLEAGLGLVTLIAGGPLAALGVCASYVGFAIYIGRSLARGTPLATCACFGEDDTPATPLHVVIDLALAAGAGWAATGEAAPVGFPALLVAAVVAYLCFLSLTSLPRALAASKR